jgi:hypothetical protein
MSYLSPISNTLDIMPMTLHPFHAPSGFPPVPCSGLTLQNFLKFRTPGNSVFPFLGHAFVSPAGVLLSKDA